LLPAEATSGGRPALERLIAQDYIIDSMLYFDGDRVESAVRLASGTLRSLTCNMLSSSNMTNASLIHQQWSIALRGVPAAVAGCESGCHSRHVGMKGICTNVDHLH
jgi:hypothetical protein